MTNGHFFAPLPSLSPLHTPPSPLPLHRLCLHKQSSVEHFFVFLHFLFCSFCSLRRRCRRCRQRRCICAHFAVAATATAAESEASKRDRERERASVSCAPLATCCGQHVPAADGLLEAVIRCVCKACKRGAARAGVVDVGRGEGGAGVEATLRLFS